ncbi:MAG: nitrite/sulfite reductase [Candidatus Omnitrophica bacterium]|nr:nitrite/sulfite reductase [Candidatus Omnitrophota bacterium]
MDERAIVDAEFLHFAGQLARFEQGRLNADVFRTLRLHYGIYRMRGFTSAHMVRVRIPLGLLQPRHLDGLADVCESLTPTRSCHLTTRQSVQLYGVQRQRLPALLRMLAGAGLTTREASGNVVRNVTCCPWAGVSREEPFDITPYARAVSEYLLRNPLTQLLPRKVKIAFEGCRTDHARTAIHDIGVVAARQHGIRGFRIYLGGGLGSAPRAARLLEPWTDATLLLPTIEAALRVFDRLGERTHRARARLKFLVERLGWEAFQDAVVRERSLVWATQPGGMLSALPPDVETADDEAGGGSAGSPSRATSRDHAADEALPAGAPPQWRLTNVVPQRRAGWLSVIVRVPLGDLSASQLRGVAQLAREHALGVRCMATQNLLLRDVPGSRFAQVYEALDRMGLAQSSAGRLADVTRCPGADTCLSAMTHPKGLAQAVEALCHNGLSSLADAPVSVKISGCPNSCGHHLIADIGCFGTAIKVGGRYLPGYQILVGGSAGEGAATFGKRLARVPARRAPEALTRLVRWYDEQKRPGETFSAAVDRVGLEAVGRLLRETADVSDAASDASLFVDLGASEPFQLASETGECAA